MQLLVCWQKKKQISNCWFFKRRR